MARVDKAHISYSEPTGQYQSFNILYGDMAAEMFRATKAGVQQLIHMDGELHKVNNRLGTAEETNRKGFQEVKDEVHGPTTGWVQQRRQTGRGSKR